MPIGAIEGYAATATAAPEPVARVSPVEADTRSNKSANMAPAEDTGGVVVSISPEAREEAIRVEEEPPKERGAPAADMSLSRALDSVDMSKQEETGAVDVQSQEPQTRTTDPMVIARAMLAG